MAALRIASLLSPYKTFSDPSASPSRDCRYISLYCPKWPRHVDTSGEGDFLRASAIAGVIYHQSLFPVEERGKLTLVLLSDDPAWPAGRSSIALPKPCRVDLSDFHSFPSTELINSLFSSSVVAPKCSINRSPAISSIPCPSHISAYS